MTDPDQIMICWGARPDLHLTGERLVGHLDAVSERRQIFILHASGHLATVNSAVIRHDNITADNPTPGIQLDEYGQPNGELQEPAAMSLASGQRMLREGYASELAKWNYAYEARNAGHTLVTDLGTSSVDEQGVANWSAVRHTPTIPLA